MWILAGPFDCDEKDVPSFRKRKLLKAGVKYILGRREDGAKLVIRQKKISRHHATLEVQSDPRADITNPTYQPKLSVVIPQADGKKGVARTMDRAPPKLQAVLNPGEIVEVEDGDVINVLLDVPVTANWERVCCYSPPTKGITPPDYDACAALGIALRPTPHPEITHHLALTYTLSPELALSLMSLATIVKPDWLTEILKLGRAGEDGDLSHLEKTYMLPSPDKHRPAFSPSLPPSLKFFGKWTPDESRLAMFRGYRFVFMGERGREVQEAMRDLVKRGEGEYECFAVEGGKMALRKVLSKGRAKGRIMVLVGEEPAVLLAVGRDAWQELVDEANSFELSVVPREKVLEAVVHADASHMNLGSRSKSQSSLESPLPDVVPNTHPEEPSIPPPTAEAVAHEGPEPPRSRLRRRAGSRATSRAPSPPADSAQAPADDAPGRDAEPPKRKTLMRRAGRSRAPIIGIDDPSMDMDGDGTPVSSSQAQAAPPDSTRAPSADPELARMRSRLKRRAGTRAVTSQILDLTTDASTHEADEPPLKKFKALFEQSNPDRIAQSGSLQTQLTTQPESVTESESHATQVQQQGARIGGATQLAAVAEEEESTGGAIVAEDTQTQRSKRKSQDVDDDIEMENGTAPASKRRAVEGVNALHPSQPQAPAEPPSRTQVKPPAAASQSQKDKSSGAAPGKPDTDEAFLKAVASTKKGKRTEDTFDREFNNLRISKPELEKDQERNSWAVLDDFGDDRDLRGNFMVIVEMEVPEKAQRPALVRGADGRTDWAGRPDFKKFHKRLVAGRRPVVEVCVEDGNDCSIGSQFWKGSRVRSQLTSQSQPDEQAERPASTPKHKVRTQIQTQTTKAKSKARAIVMDDTDEELPPPVKSQKTRKKDMGGRVRSHSGSTQPRSTAQKTIPLFIESDEDEQNARRPSQVGEDGDLNPIIEVDGMDDDDTSTLRSSGATTQSRMVRQSSRNTSKKVTPAVILDDDSDDQVLKGFGRKSARRK